MRCFVLLGVMFALAGSAVAQSEPRPGIFDHLAKEVSNSQSDVALTTALDQVPSSDPLRFYRTADKKFHWSQLGFDSWDKLTAEQEIRQEDQCDAKARDRSINGVYVDVMNLRRSLPVAPTYIDAIQPGSVMSMRVAVEFDDWEAIWAGANEFQGEDSGFVYKSKFTSVEVNWSQSERPLFKGRLEFLSGFRYLGLNDIVSCPPFEQKASNDMVGVQRVFHWRRNLGNNLNIYARNTTGVLANFVDKKHGSFFADQEVLASLQSDIHVGLDIHLWRGIHANVAYQAYYILNIQSAYAATPSFVEVHEGHVYIQGVAFGLSKQY